MVLRRILKIVTGLSVFIVEDIPGVWAVVECISPIPNQCHLIVI